MRVGRRARGNGGLAAGPANAADLPDRAWKLFDVVEALLRCPIGAHDRAR